MERTQRSHSQWRVSKQASEQATVAVTPIVVGPCRWCETLAPDDTNPCHQPWWLKPKGQGIQMTIK